MACLTDKPEVCRKVVQTFTDITTLQCMMTPPSALAKFHEEHPAFTIKKWGCRPAQTFAKGAA
jgi:hypothetical protein